MTRFQRINESSFSSLWAFLILKAQKGLVVLGKGPWTEVPRLLGPKSHVTISERFLASFPQTTCINITWEAFAKMHVWGPCLRWTESTFLGPDSGICCFLKLPK